MKFDLEKSIEILERTPAVLEALLSGLSEEWIRSNEGTNTWSPYDVIGHLIHGEKTDWLPRSRIILSDQLDRSLEPFDRFAQEQEDQTKPIGELLEEFRELRAANLRELKSFQIDNEKLKEKGVHPEFGEINLKQMLSTWTVHDLGHIAQISRVMASQYDSEVGPWKQYLRILNP